jgi:ankyrin repeat protein
MLSVVIFCLVLRTSGQACASSICWLPLAWSTTAVDASLVQRSTQRKDGDGAVLAMLIAAGADVNARSVKGNTALHCACSARKASVDVLAQLIGLCDVNATNNAGETPCWLAAWQCNAIVLKMLISAGANFHATDCSGFSAAMIVVQREDVALLEILVDSGVNMNVVDPEYGTTPLHVAAKGGSHRLLRHFIATGADVNSTNKQKQTPLHMLKNQMNPGDALLSATVLLAAKADVNALDEDGNTPLHAVARAGLHDCVSLLIEAGAMIEARNGDNQTPLLCACGGDAAGLRSTLSVLIAAGADPHAKASAGESALHIAAKSGSTDAISILIDASVDVNVVDDAGDSAGHWAARAGRFDNLKRLFQHGAQIDQRNNAGKTMLRVAAGAKTCAVESMRLLIDTGADVRVIDDAVAHGANATVFSLLRSLGVNLKAVDDRGNTPFHSARDVAAMVALFAHGAATLAKNNANLTPFEAFSLRFERDPWDQSEDAMLVFAAGGLGFDLEVDFARLGFDVEVDFAQLPTAGGELMWRLEEIMHFARGCATSDRNLSERVFKKQKELFQARAFQVCVGLQPLCLSALEICEVLAHLFAPLESMVPLQFAWRVVVTVKHFKQRQ